MSENVAMGLKRGGNSGFMIDPKDGDAHYQVMFDIYRWSSLRDD